jgi:hypothetical protein
LIESIYTEKFYQYLLELHTADICAHWFTESRFTESWLYKRGEIF